MNYFTQSRGFKLVTILLLILNLAILVTVVFRVTPLYRPEKSVHEKKVSPPHFLQEKLQLTPEQVAEFEELRTEFDSIRKKIRKEMAEQRDLIVSELTKENPDTTYLSELTYIYGQLHSQMKMETIDHLLSLKEICSPEQQEELYLMFKDMIKKEGRHWKGKHRKHHRSEKDNPPDIKQ